MSRAVMDENEDRGIDVKLAGTIPKTKATEDPFGNSFVKNGVSGLKPNLKKKITVDMKKFHSGADGAKSKKVEIDATGYGYLDVVQPPHNLDNLVRLTQISAPHLAAIRAKVVNVVGLGFKLVESPKTKRKLDKTNGETKTARLRQRLDQARDELLEYIDQLNEEESLIDSLSKSYFDYETTGVGYIEIGRTDAGNIGYIGHIPCTTVRVRRERDGYVQIVSNRAVFFRNFGKNTEDPIGTDSNPNEIIMLKKYSPENSFYGLPDVIPAAAAIAGNEFASRFNIDFFENKAMPRHLVVLKGATLSSMAENRLSEFFDTGMKGVNHRSLYVPLPADTPDSKVELKVIPVEAGVQDLSFERYRKSNLGEILLAHRVPPNKIGVSEGISVAASLDASKTFKEQVCSPEQRMLAKKLNRVIGELTDVFIVEFNELSLTDEDTQSKIYERYLRNQVLTPNDVLANLGRPGRKGGDKPVELKAQAKAEQRADAGKTRQEDSDRSATTSTTDAEGRAPKGEGRKE